MPPPTSCHVPAVLPQSQSPTKEPGSFVWHTKVSPCLRTAGKLMYTIKESASLGLQTSPACWGSSSGGVEESLLSGAANNASHLGR